MQDKIKQKGFIKTPIIFAIIVGVLVFSGISYIVIRQYQHNQQKKAVSEKQAQELAKLQQDKEKQIEEKKNQELERRIKELENQPPQTIIKEISPPTTQNQEISAQEISPYLTGVIKIDCKNQEGSGTLWKIGDENYILTNFHVVSNPYPAGQCNVVVQEKDSSNGVGIYQIYPSTGKSWNSYTDVSLLKISAIEIEGITSLPIRNLNYNITSLRQCPHQVSLGLSVVIIGYPVFSLSPIQYQGEKLGEQTVRTITNGIISSYDSSKVKPFGSLPYPDYFVSAKIDSGNSGGMAFSKDSNGLCILGIPTWLSIGNYETQGIIQNIYNIMYTGN